MGDVPLKRETGKEGKNMASSLCPRDATHERQHLIKTGYLISSTNINADIVMKSLTVNNIAGMLNPLMYRTYT